MRCDLIFERPRSVHISETEQDTSTKPKLSAFSEGPFSISEQNSLSFWRSMKGAAQSTHWRWTGGENRETKSCVNKRLRNKVLPLSGDLVAAVAFDHSIFAQLLYLICTTIIKYLSFNSRPITNSITHMNAKRLHLFSTIFTKNVPC